MAQPLAITVGSGIPEDQLPPGTYPATLKAVVERTITVQNEDRDVFEWTFLVDTENEDGTPGDPIEVAGLTSQMTGPQSKTAAFLAALLGPEAVQPGVTFTMNDLAGKRCLIQTVLNKGGYAKVDGAIALPQQTAKPKTRAVQTASATPAASPAPAAATPADAAAAPAAAAVAEEAAEVLPEADDDLPF